MPTPPRDRAPPNTNAPPQPDFIEKSVPIVPISGWMGDNLIKKSEKMAWWNGMEVKTLDDRTVKVETLLNALNDMAIVPERKVGAPGRSLRRGPGAGGCRRSLFCFGAARCRRLELPPKLRNCNPQLGRPSAAPLPPQVDAPLRVPISGAYKIKGVGDVLAGRVEQGVVKPGDEVIFLPTHTTANPCVGKVFTVEMHHKRVDKAGPGDNVGMNIKVRRRGREGGRGVRRACSVRAGSSGRPAGAQQRRLQRHPCCAGAPSASRGIASSTPTPLPQTNQGLDKGNMPRTGDVMILKSDQTLKPCKDFTAQIQTLDIPGEVKAGYSPIGFVRCGRSACKITKINWKVGKETGGKKLDAPHALKANEMAEVVFEPCQPLVVDHFKACEGLSRIAFLDGNTAVMLGKVTAVSHK